MTGTHWTLGVLIGLPIAALAVIGCVWLAVVLSRDAWVGPFESRLFIVVAALIVIITAAAMFPWTAQYHQWRPVSGPVQEVGKRLIGGDSIEERYVLVINGQPYGVDDTRASLVKVGDVAHLSCRRAWQYASVPGYVCRWNGKAQEGQR